jgi:hypothetical protein
MNEEIVKTLRDAAAKNDLERLKELLLPECGCEYFSQYTDNLDKFVYVYSPKTTRWSEQDLSVFIGPLSGMNEVSVKNVDFDEGALYISLFDGSCLRFPSLKSHKEATHDEVILNPIPVRTVRMTLVPRPTTVIDEVIVTGTGVQVNDFSGRKRTRISKMIASGGGTQHNIF